MCFWIRNTRIVMISIIASGKDIDCHMTKQGISKSVEKFWRHRRPIFCSKFWDEVLSLHYLKHSIGIWWDLWPYFIMAVSWSCFSKQLTLSETFTKGSYSIIILFWFGLLNDRKRKKWFFLLHSMHLKTEKGLMTNNKAP